MTKLAIGQRCVFVLSKDGRPLMPSTRFGKVKRLLKSGKAKPVCNLPFTIQLTYDLSTETFQELAIGIDPGRTNIGVSVVREDGKCLYRAILTTRNKQIPKLMEKRREHRYASRRGERLRRKRRAKKNGTIMKNGYIDRILPGYSKPVRVKDIKNTEAKFINRRISRGWLTPTARHLLSTHINLVKRIQKILPVTKACVEVNKFNFMMLDNPGVSKRDIDFKHGPLYGYENVRNYIDKMQNDVCLLCGKNPIEHIHHVLTKKLNGSNTVDNLVGLCNKCHIKVHTDIKAKEKLSLLHTKRNKKYGALSILNQIISRLIEELLIMFPNETYLTDGYQTKLTRIKFGVDKDHDLDAYCIAIQSFDFKNVVIDRTPPKKYEIVQCRRQNRAKIDHQHERTYKLDGIIVAKNRRKRTDQFEDSLHEWYLKAKKTFGILEARRLQSKLVVTKSKPAYNNLNRVMPGSIFEFEGKRYVMRSQNNNGRRYKAFNYDGTSFSRKKCTILYKNSGLVYIS